MSRFRGFAVAGALAALLTAVLGSWVRINGAGLTCPDWPLCHGALVPVFSGGVVLEWTHRLSALAIVPLVAGTLWTGWPLRRRFAGLGATLAALAAIFAVQVVLGALTVRLANSPASVTIHWATAMALLAAFVVAATLTFAGTGTPERRAALEGPAAILAIAALLAFATMCAGAYVSSSHAGLACNGLPLCSGTLLGMTGAQHAQMLHRIFAAMLAVLVGIALGRTYAPRARAALLAATALIALQIALGSANVLWALPAPLRELHAVVATLIFIALALATALAALDPAFATDRIAVRAQPAGAPGS